MAMMTNNKTNDPIADALNLVPITPVQFPTRTDVKAVIKDKEYDTAKGNLEQLSNVGMDAIGQLAELAAMSQDARVYRVLGEFMTVVKDVQVGLVDIKKISIETDQLDKTGNSPSTINQTLNLQMTTADLVKMIKDATTNNESEEQDADANREEKS